MTLRSGSLFGVLSTLLAIALACGGGKPEMAEKTAEAEAPKPLVTSSGPWSFSCTSSDLIEMDDAALRIARNEVYARHGRAFKSKDLREHFGATDWYKVDPDYSDSRLTKADHNCIARLRTVPKGGGSKSTINPGDLGRTTANADLDGDGQKDQIRLSDRTLFINRNSVTLPALNGQFGVDLAVIDLDAKDGQKEVVVSVADLAGEDEYAFWVLTYGNGQLIPMLDRFVAISSPIEVGHQKLSVTTVNCGQTYLDEFRMKTPHRLSHRETTKGKFDEDQCAACPFVYRVEAGHRRYLGEVLRYMVGEAAHRTDELAIGQVSAGETVQLVMSEEKPETTYLDAIHLRVGDQIVVPMVCQKDAEDPMCQSDGRFRVIPEGGHVDLEFSIPVSGTGQLVANGYYVPTQVRIAGTN